jgi:hypothetical protein
MFLDHRNTLGLRSGYKTGRKQKIEGNAKGRHHQGQVLHKVLQGKRKRLNLRYELITILLKKRKQKAFT